VHIISVNDTKNLMLVKLIVLNQKFIEKKAGNTFFLSQYAYKKSLCN